MLRVAAQDLARLRQIAGILARHGYLQLASNLREGKVDATDPEVQALGELELALGQIRTHQGRTAEARTLLAAAHRDLTLTLDPDHVLVKQTERALAELERRR